MPFDRQAHLSENDLNQIHHASMEILARGGLAFHHDEAVSIFKDHGFAVSGKKVFITEKDVCKALETAPERFLLTGRNPKRSRWIGGDDFVFVPTYGPPFIVESDGAQRPGTLADYELAVKLNHTSEVSDVIGFKFVAPSDVRAVDSYLDMQLLNLTLSDKPVMGSSDDQRAAQDTMDMLKLIWGGNIDDKSLAVGLINPLSPLAFAEDMVGAILTYARHRQPLIILNMILAGSSGPIRLPGLLALMNAEILGGLVLTQLVGPGAPVIYGTTSCPIYMKTGGAAVGNPETLRIASATMQLARYYKLPCRTGGSLTDSLAPDGQAMAESALSLINAVRGGANFMLHAMGMMGGYIGLSFEKWIMDEEVCRYALTLIEPLEINETSLDVEGIIKVGSGGSFLTRPETMKLCRSAFLEPMVFNKLDEAARRKAGGEDLLSLARRLLIKRRENFQAPDMDPALARDLAALVESRRRR